jgi:uncharacterized protein DUF5069
MEIPGLRSPYEMVGGIVHFGRMLDKIRLSAAGGLPSGYQLSLGNASPHSFDGYCCRFLQIEYEALTAQTLLGGSDESLVQWAWQTGRQPSEKDAEIWNAFMQKRGWRDSRSERLQELVRAERITGRVVATLFDFMDADEGRPPRFPEDPPTPGQPMIGTARIPGLRSPREKVGGIVHFGRMLDKIRLAQSGKLPPEWAASKGSVTGFDGCCCHLLQVNYQELEKVALKGGDDDRMLEWAFSHGQPRSEEEIEIWNAYLTKRCWRDRYIPRLHVRLQEAGLPLNSALTMFDCIDLEEGRAIDNPEES